MCIRDRDCVDVDDAAIISENTGAETVQPFERYRRESMTENFI